MWLKTMVDFYDVYICPALDILFLAFVLYTIYKVLVKTQALQLLRGAFMLLGIYAIAFVLRLNTILWLLSIITPGLVIGVAIVFQPELRKIFFKMGQANWLYSTSRQKHTNIDSIITAAEILSEHKRGMLVVFSMQNNLKDIVESGTRIDAEISSSILVTIFGHDTPLHDGAVIIQNGKLISAGCLLPLSEQQDIKKSFGTRHRAALGVSEISDAVILIVSEESGAISLAYDSKIYYDLGASTVMKRLESILNIKSNIRESEIVDGEV